MGPGFRRGDIYRFIAKNPSAAPHKKTYPLPLIRPHLSETAFGRDVPEHPCRKAGGESASGSVAPSGQRGRRAERIRTLPQ